MLKSIRQSIGYTNYLFFALTVIAVLVFLLDSTRGCNEEILNFCTNVIFIIVFIVSVGMLLLLSAIQGKFVLQHDSKGGKFSYKSVEFFYLEDINLKQVILIPVGLGAVFTVSYIAILGNNPLAGIFGSGLVMAAIFGYTRSAMPVILIHGIYNALVVFLRAQQLTLFSTSSPIYVPNVSFNVFPQQLINEMLTQIVLVAPAEELFKIFMMTVFIIIIKLKFDTSGLGSRIVAMISAVIVWSLFHLQVSLR